MSPFPIEVCTFLFHLFLSSHLTYHVYGNSQIWCILQGVASQAGGGLVDPPRLPWSVYTYGADKFARESLVGCNPNVMD